MFRSEPGVKRPFLYAVAAAFAIALAMPLAVSSGQLQAGGMFDECYGAQCDGAAMFASAD